MAVFVAVFTVAGASGAHINPAVTLGLAAADKFPWVEVPVYIVAQMMGATLGAVLVWLHYQPHFATTDSPDAKLAAFATDPAIDSPLDNVLSEMIGTFVLVFAILHLATSTIAEPDGVTGGLSALDALPVGLLVLSIDLSLGGTTGYAINSARDLAPRVVHAVLPLPGKRNSNWGYAWIPVFGPLIGDTLTATAYRLFGEMQVPLELSAVMGL